MTPPRNSPDRESNIFPGNRYPFWVRRSDHHPMVQSRPNQIIDDTNALIRRIQGLRSPSPGTFSRFSSRPGTPGTSMQHPPPPPPATFQLLPPPLHPHPYLHPHMMARDTPSQFPVYSYPPPPLGEPCVHVQQQLPLPPAIHLPPPPLSPPPSGGSQGQQAPERTTVSVSFPINSGAIGGTTTTRICPWDTVKSFADFWLQMCENMELDPQTAVIGYKISGDRVRDAAREMSTEQDYKIAMESILKKTRNARSKIYMLVLQNLRPNQHTAASKRKQGDDDSSVTDAQLHRRYVGQLQSKLKCRRHKRGYCLVRGSDPVMASHEELDEPALSYWARMIIEHEATLEHPPSNMVSDCRKRKKPRTTPSNPALPVIHVHNHLPGSGARIGSYFDAPANSPPTPSTPLPTTVKRSNSTPFQHPSHPPQQQQRITIDLTDSNSDDEDLRGICYPSVHEMLVELDLAFPLLNIHQHEHVLVGNGFLHVNQLVGGEVGRQLQDVLGIPLGVVIRLQTHAVRLMHRTQKSKKVN